MAELEETKSRKAYSNWSTHILHMHSFLFCRHNICWCLLIKITSLLFQS